MKKDQNAAMCDELGKLDNMKDYIDEAGQTSLCNIHTKVGCTDKESSFIDKMKSESKDSLSSQVSRLEGMKTGSMKADLRGWISQRIAILKKLTAEL